MGLFTGIVKGTGTEKDIEKAEVENKKVGLKVKLPEVRIGASKKLYSILTNGSNKGDSSFLTKRRYPFGKASMEKLKTAHPDLQRLALAAAQVIPLTVVTGTRPPEEQNRLLSLGRTKAKPGFSKHNITPSFAIDMVPMIDGKLVYDNDTCYMYSGIIMMIGNMLFGEGYIICGSNWYDPLYDCRDHFKDPTHFEIADKYMAGLKAPYPNQPIVV